MVFQTRLKNLTSTSSKVSTLSFSPSRKKIYRDGNKTFYSTDVGLYIKRIKDKDSRRSIPKGLPLRFTETIGIGGDDPVKQEPTINKKI